MTFTVLAVDPAAGVLGVATASYSLAVGNSVPAVDPSTGAVASQAWTNRQLRQVTLQVLAEGGSPRQAIDALAGVDPSIARRQVGVVDRSGRTASHTGDGCTPWAGSRAEPGRLFLGNCLRGPEVLTAMQQSMQQSMQEMSIPEHGSPRTPRGLAHALVTALAAGQQAGGDRRGNQSAAVMAARFRSDAGWPPLLTVDLRVDDHPEPIPELRRLVDLAAASSTPSAH